MQPPKRNIPAGLIGQLHIWAGLAYMAPASLYVYRHWRWYSAAEGAESGMKAFGYLATLVVAGCVVTGVVATILLWADGEFSFWMDLHLPLALVSLALVGLHLGAIAFKASRQKELGNQ